MSPINILPPVFELNPDSIRHYLDVNFKRIVDSLTPNLTVDGILRVKGTTTSPGSSRFWTGIEIANPTSDPFIDFHHSANPEEATDYDVRLINDSAGGLSLWRSGTETATSGLLIQNSWIRIMDDRGIFWNDYGGGWFMDNSSWGPQSYGGKQVRCDPAAFGSSPAYGTNYAWFGHKDFISAGQYALMQGNDGTTYINAASGKGITFRIDNNVIGEIFAGSNRLVLSTGADALADGDRVLRLHVPSRPGIAGYLTGVPIIYQIVNQGSGWDSFDAVGNARPYRASAFTVISKRSTKIEESIKSLDKQVERDRLKQLNPVRFRRPHGSPCAACSGQGCDRCSADGVPGQINRPFIDKNDDTDFVGFIAEEVAEIYPEVIGWEPSDPDDWWSEPRPAGIDLGAMVAVVVAAQQEMLERLEALERKSK